MSSRRPRPSGWRHRARRSTPNSTAPWKKRAKVDRELGQATQTTLEALKRDVSAQLGAMSQALKDQLEATGGLMHRQFAALQDSVAQQLQAMVQGAQHNSEQLRAALNERLAAIQADNTTKLEEMRRTVDEKLHATLEQRLGDSFRLVSERLEQVHAGLAR
jgi:DNA recombination protein RmuC